MTPSPGPSRPADRIAELLARDGEERAGSELSEERGQAAEDLVELLDDTLALDFNSREAIALLFGWSKALAEDLSGLNGLSGNALLAVGRSVSVGRRGSGALPPNERLHVRCSGRYRPSRDPRPGPRARPRRLRRGRPDPGRAPLGGGRARGQRGRHPMGAGPRVATCAGSGSRITGNDRLTFVDVAEPVVGPGEVRVRIRAAAFNHLDRFTLAGIPGVSIELPHILGSDGAGDVDSVGAGVEGLRLGQSVLLNPGLWDGTCEACAAGNESFCRNYRIVGEHTQGTAAPYVVVPARNVHPRPDRLSVPEAAAVPLVFQTAWRAIRTVGATGPGDQLAVIGAGGGATTAVVQVGKLLGARVVVASRNRTKEAAARAIGADDFVAFDDDHPLDRVRWQASGKRGFDVVFDSVGASTLPRSIRAPGSGRSGRRHRGDLRAGGGGRRAHPLLAPGLDPREHDGGRGGVYGGLGPPRGGTPAARGRFDPAARRSRGRVPAGWRRPTYSGRSS